MEKAAHFACLRLVEHLSASAEFMCLREYGKVSVACFNKLFGPALVCSTQIRKCHEDARISLSTLLL